jgi:hypothetical protein
MNRQIALDETDLTRKSHPQALWLAPTNVLVDQRNEMCFNNLVASGVYCTRIFAQHYSKHTDTMDTRTLETLFKTDGKGDKNGAGPSSQKVQLLKLDLAIGSRVAVSKNVATELGLYQGALGTVVGFGYDSNEPKHQFPSLSDFLRSAELNTQEIPVVFVQMDVLGDSNKANGGTLNLSCMANKPRVVPFTATPSMRCLKHTYYRYQLPLVPAHCRTFHKAQGLTAAYGVVITPSPMVPFAMGLEYVAISRAKTLSGVVLVNRLRHDHFETHGKERHTITAEYRRMYRKLVYNGNEPATYTESAVKRLYHGDIGFTATHLLHTRTTSTRQGMRMRTSPRKFKEAA